MAEVKARVWLVEAEPGRIPVAVRRGVLAEAKAQVGVKAQVGKGECERLVRPIGAPEKGDNDE